jgi:glycerophosphoryl diester phosphodiesterase
MTETSGQTGPHASSWLRGHLDAPWLLAHRGGHGPWRENTLEAFTGGLSQGADGVELDVRATADGVLVVHHDPVIEGVGPVDQLRSTQLPSRVPTLAESLGACAGAILNVEIKPPGNVSGRDATERLAQRVVEALRPPPPSSRVELQERDPAPGPSHLLISSFSTIALKAANAALRSTRVCGAGNGPKVSPEPDDQAELPALGLLVPPGADPSAAIDEAAALGCVALNPFYAQVTGDLVARAHDAGMAVVTWTVNDPVGLEAMVVAGVDAVVSDEVASSRTVLGR